MISIPIRTVLLPNTFSMTCLIAVDINLSHLDINQCDASRAVHNEGYILQIPLWSTMSDVLPFFFPSSEWSKPSPQLTNVTGARARSKHKAKFTRRQQFWMLSFFSVSSSQATAGPEADTSANVCQDITGAQEVRLSTEVSLKVKNEKPFSNFFIFSLTIKLAYKKCAFSPNIRIIPYSFKKLVKSFFFLEKSATFSGKLFK